MAYTTTQTGTLAAAQFIPKYWDTVLGENLYPNLYMYQFGTKRTVPRNFGKTIFIPRLKKQNIVGLISEYSGTVIGTSGVCGNFISGTMLQFAGAYRHSDLVVMTALSDIVELSLIDIARDIARKMDRVIRNAISGTGVLLSGTKVSTNVFNIFKPANIIDAVVTLDGADNPRPPDNHYPTIIHPYTTYDLQTNLSGGSWLDVIKYTVGNVNRAYIGEIGRLYGARFVTSTNLRRKALSVSSTASGTMGFMFAPDAYYVTEISELTAKTYVKQLGSAGAADPVNQFATVGAKVFFGVVPASWTSTEYRMVRLLYGMGKTVTASDTA